MPKNPFTIIFGIEPDSMIPRNKEYMQIVNDFESPSPVSYAYVITGVRGCGKTVLMNSIQNYFATQKNWIVLRYREILKENGLIDTNTYGMIFFTLPRFKEFVLHIEEYMLPELL